MRKYLQIQLFKIKYKYNKRKEMNLNMLEKEIRKVYFVCFPNYGMCRTVKEALQCLYPNAEIELVERDLTALEVKEAIKRGKFNGVPDKLTSLTECIQEYSDGLVCFMASSDKLPFCIAAALQGLQFSVLKDSRVISVAWHVNFEGQGIEEIPIPYVEQEKEPVTIS